MANLLYDTGREGFLLGEIAWVTPSIKLLAVRAYTFSAAHKFVSDVTAAGGTIANTSAVFTAKTSTAGVADAADVTYTAFTAGAAVPALILIQSSAVTGGADVAATAQRVIAFIDTYTNLPFTPNGGDITIVFDNTANRIFKL